MKKTNYIAAVGRRKTSSVRIRVFKGTGENIINDKKAGEYFPGKVSKAIFERPFVLTQTFGKYFFTAKIKGGGKKGQLEALAHAIARSLKELDLEKNKKPLKKYGLLTRDSRSRLRRMVGTGGKARRQKQSPKR